MLIIFAYALIAVPMWYGVKALEKKKWVLGLILLVISAAMSEIILGHIIDLDIGDLHLHF